MVATLTKSDHDQAFASTRVELFRTLLLVSVLTGTVWTANYIWLSLDKRPPVWDKALHQTYAFNYGSDETSIKNQISVWLRSGIYPPFVHILIGFLKRRRDREWYRHKRLYVSSLQQPHAPVRISTSTVPHSSNSAEHAGTFRIPLLSG